ncbi:hypothetical protein CEXT_734781 [Caerostris extrusa]|uniref:Uncharacterized protein n=1 Tax=Caerostris extrusa TaxID=172846 RepID=A0AAV4MJE0_CAEEX|nr:hypothetical protein CEXT_734781 [Caerostris extrusa]
MLKCFSPLPYNPSEGSSRKRIDNISVRNKSTVLKQHTTLKHFKQNIPSGHSGATEIDCPSEVSSRNIINNDGSNRKSNNAEMFFSPFRTTQVKALLEKN